MITSVIGSRKLFVVADCSGAAASAYLSLLGSSAPEEQASYCDQISKYENRKKHFFMKARQAPR
jgi:hypothetical protein